MPIINEAEISSVFEMDQKLPLDPTLFLRIRDTVQHVLKRKLETYTGTLFTSGPARRKHSRITGIYKECLLEVFGEDVVQEFNCSPCKNFLHFIGGLRGLTPQGEVIDLLWDPEYVEEEDLKPFFALMHGRVSKERTRGPLIVGCDNTSLSAIERQCTATPLYVTFGHGEVGGYPHYTIQIPTNRLMVVDYWSDVDKIEKKLSQSLEQIIVTLKEPGFTAERIDRATMILSSDLCDREEFVGKVGLPWWRNLVTALEGTIVWRDIILQHMCAKTTSFPYATFSLHSSSVWTIFERLQGGDDNHTVARIFKSLTRSDRYMRSMTEATAASIARAEEKIEELGVSSALRRRGAAMEDVAPYLIWTAPEPVEIKVEAEASARPLDILRKPKAPRTTGAILSEDVIKAQTLSKVMTWVKFKTQVLPKVDQMWVKFTREPVGLYTLMTQTDPEAAPILVWDKPDNRCPISWYTYVHGMPLSEYKGNIHQAYRVTGIMPNPSQRPSLPELSRVEVGSKCDFLILEGLKDTKFDVGGIRLFPEIVRRDLQTDAGMRRVIEQYSQTAQVDTEVQALVSVPSVTAPSWRPIIIVRTKTGAYESYVVDRLD